MKLLALLAMLVCSVTAADITIVVTPSSSNVVITITVPSAAATNVTAISDAATNAVVAVQQVPDARSSTPRPFPMPPMPPAQVQMRIKDWHGDPSKFVWKTVTVDAPWFKPLPGGTNRTYSEHQAWMAERQAVGKRRSE